ncbi:MAG: methionine biosynthesis protein MetW [Desulfobacterales bacterium]|nr:methionine biosynthesis protein MetW [Desulfobacterales bacterium]MDP6681378.1 methionine biosynthesis protein MetW [Desulfobacterales bacterium]MDP6808980.1 methionine biosynthesis protein MetW [Desulfobacterales bacterium]
MSAAKTDNHNMRFDLRVIASWIEPGAKVISLGCGEGDLLSFLKKNKQIIGTGIDNNEDKVARCIERGLSVLQGDINEELSDYPDGSFDYVVLSQTLQQIYEPSILLRAMLRIGKKGIVSFPNFSHWRIRLQLLFTGYAPVSHQLPFDWYDTPNIRVITIKDFRKYSKKVGFNILKEVAINTNGRNKQEKIIKYLPNMLATYGIFLIANGRS